MRKLVVTGAIALIVPAIAMAAPMDQSASQPATVAEPAPAPVDARMAVAEKVRADWPKYDTNAKGHLTRAELGKWLADLRVAAGQPAPDAEWQKSAFVQTDINRDTKISVEELTAFLTAGA